MNKEENESVDSNNKKERTLTLGSVLGWGLGVFIGFIGIIQLFEQISVGIIFILMALVLLPPVNKYVKSKYNFSISKGMKIVLLIVLLAVAGALGTGSDTDSESVSSNKTKVSQKTVKEYIEVTAGKLYQDYRDNGVSADSKYKNNFVRMSGIVSSIDKDILDTPYVVLTNGSGSILGVQCMFSKSKESELSTLSKGQNITLTGKVNGNLIGNVIVEDCSIDK